MFPPSYGLADKIARFSVGLVMLDSGSTISLIPENILNSLNLQATLALQTMKITIADRSLYLLTKFVIVVIRISRV